MGNMIIGNFYFYIYVGTFRHCPGFEQHIKLFFKASIGMLQLSWYYTQINRIKLSYRLVKQIEYCCFGSLQTCFDIRFKEKYYKFLNLTCRIFPWEVHVTAKYPGGKKIQWPDCFVYIMTNLPKVSKYTWTHF